jgi:hypothetical protein
MLSNDLKVEAFYNIMRVIKINCKPQLNRYYLKMLINSEELESGFKKLKRKVRNADYLSNDELAGAVRKLSFMYLRLISRYSIMTSKKMNQKLWDLHFKKCH